MHYLPVWIRFFGPTYFVQTVPQRASQCFASIVYQYRTQLILSGYIITQSSKGIVKQIRDAVLSSAPRFKADCLCSTGKLRLFKNWYVDVELLITLCHSAQDTVDFLPCLLAHVRHMRQRDMIHECFHSAINPRYLVLCQAKYAAKVVVVRGRV